MNKRSLPKTSWRIVHLLLCIIIVSSVIMYVGCSKKTTEPDEPDYYDPIIPPTTKVVDEFSSLLISDIDSNYTFTVYKGDPVFDNLQTGNVLVSGISGKAPYGYLRKVQTITDNGNTLTITTSEASLSDAIQQGSLRISEPLKSTGIKSIWLADGVTFKKPDPESKLLGFDFQFRYAIYNNPPDSIVLDGSLYFDLSFNLDIDFVEFVPDYAKFSIEIDEMAELGAVAHYEGSIEKEFKFAEILFNPWVFAIGIVPVVVLPSVEFWLKADGTFSVNVTSRITQTYNAEAGIKYEGIWDGWSVFCESNPSFEFLQPSLEGQVDFEVKAGPRAELYLYGFAGAFMEMWAYAELEGNVSTKTDYDIDLWVGLKGDVGIDINVVLFGWGETMEVFDFRENIYHLEDGPIPTTFDLLYPYEGKELIIGDSVVITTYYTGDIPNNVQFYIDGNLKHTDSASPFTYGWLTEGISTGNHTVQAKANYTSSQISSSLVNVTLLNPTWEYLRVNDYSHEDFHSVWFVNKNEGWIVSPEKILHTTDGGTSWVSQYDGGYNDFDDMIFLEGNKGNEGWVTGSWTILYTNDGGNTWTNKYDYIYDQIGPPPCDKMAVAKNGNIIIGNNASFIYSEDYGITWHDASIPSIDFGIIEDIQFDENTGWAIFNDPYNYDDQLIKSTDGGKNWTLVDSNISSQNLNCVYFTSSSNGWIGTHAGVASGTLLHTTNAGVTWTDQVPGQNFHPYSLCFINDNEGYVAGFFIPHGGWGMYSRIMHTTNGGQTWSEVVLQDLGEEIYDIFFIDEVHGWATGDNGTFYRYGLSH
ncbi:MAG: hypothetical protein KAW88_01170 [Candidatus Cloacimonetes bacterium]|nr:hypothetical protein [Candidatus Cloacimonadota bacterium]